ncbi:TolC family protein [Cognatiluteimonas lumbrici]|uniref:TolC family protein n=1 Tax=Cognatiluteimonas lumbrici TaxID=2559601 RepID=UPI00112E0875|nr:TolC family protein [Luteimonas lumbrici]
MSCSPRLRRRKVARLGIAMAACLFPMLGLAQVQSARAPAPVQEALQSAWQRYPGYRAAQAQLAAAQARRTAAGQPLYNPELEFAAEDEGPDRRATVGVDLTLDLSGKREARLEAADARLDLAVAEARVRERDFIRLWFTGWTAWLSARERLQTGEQRLALMTRFAELAEKQFDAGDISGLERDLAALARDEARSEQAQLIAEEAEAQARFRAVGGVPGQLDALALGVPPPPPMLADPPLPVGLPEWQVAQAAVEAAEGDVLVASRNRRPDPTVGVSGGRIDYGNVQDRIIGISVRIPLFVRNSYRAEVVAAQADVEAAAADAERIRLELAAGQQAAIESYRATQSAWASWQSSRGTEVSRREALLERLWREGELSTADYLLQIKQTLDTQLAGAELQARLWRSYVDYLAAVGQLTRWSGLEATP